MGRGEMRVFLIICTFFINLSVFARQEFVAIIESNGEVKFEKKPPKEEVSIDTFTKLQVEAEVSRSPLPTRIRQLFSSSGADQFFGVLPSIYKSDKCSAEMVEEINSDSTRFSCAFRNENGQLVLSTCRWRAKRIDLDLTGQDGGHNHTHTTRPKGSFTTAGISTPLSDFFFEYFATEIAGLEMFEVTGAFPYENEFGNTEWADFTPFRIGVYTSSMGSFSIQSVNGVTEEEGYEGVQFFAVPEFGEGYSFAISSHPGDGRSVILRGVESLQSLPSIYRGRVQLLYPEIFSLELNDLFYTSASMLDGGLYDIARNWQPSHCGHRNGIDVDIDIQQRNLTFADQLPLNITEYYLLINELRISIEAAGFHFPVANESPLTISSHWHIRLN